MSILRSLHPRNLSPFQNTISVMSCILTLINYFHIHFMFVFHCCEQKRSNSNLWTIKLFMLFMHICASKKYCSLTFHLIYNKHSNLNLWTTEKIFHFFFTSRCQKVLVIVSQICFMTFHFTWSIHIWLHFSPSNYLIYTCHNLQYM